MRRRLRLLSLLFAAALAGLAACGAAGQEATARLDVRAHAVRTPLAPGRHELASAGPGAFVYVPAKQGALPVLILLHGAARTLPPLEPFITAAEHEGFALAVPFAREHTWDLMAAGGYGVDVRMLDRLLSTLFDGIAIDTTRVALAGFSDGASYALSLALQNGDVFTHAIAFSPGFIGPGKLLGKPKVFISHGRSDRVLSIDVTRRDIVRELDRAGIRPLFHEFDGGHTVPVEARTRALQWWLTR